MKNTIIYIDGGNLYYGQLRGSANKWLDLEAFSAKLLNPDHAIAAVKYFTSRVIDKSADQCRLPDSFETSDGRTIRCPAAWMPGRTGDS